MPPSSPTDRALENNRNEDLPQELSIEEGQDYIIDDQKQLPFDIHKVLGHGVSAVVSQVWDRNSKKVYAKKTISFPGPRQRLLKEERFNNEVQIIRNLMGHHHIIRVFATYVAKREFGMILEPVADVNLFEFLENYMELTDRTTSPDTATLEKSFGCLASGLAYIHQRGIRHKDIKPQNILVYRDTVIYTDFGASKAFHVASESTTEGPPDFLTRKYSAPEVLDHDRRNYAADVFSLGCVFIEILSALHPKFIFDQGLLFAKIINHIHKELQELSLPSNLSSLPKFITSMTQHDMAGRAKIAQISSGLCETPALCCKLCNAPMKASQNSSSEPVWTWSRANNRYYSYRYDGGVVVETIWSDDPGPLPHLAELKLEGSAKNSGKGTITEPPGTKEVEKTTSAKPD